MPADNTVRKVLIATDGSPASFAAISDLVHAGLPPEGEAVVLSIADRVPLFPPRTPEEILYLEDARLAVPRHWARSAADILRRRFPQWVVREETRAGARDPQLCRRMVAGFDCIGVSWAFDAGTVVLRECVAQGYAGSTDIGQDWAAARASRR